MLVQTYFRDKAVASCREQEATGQATHPLTGQELTDEDHNTMPPQRSWAGTTPEFSLPSAKADERTGEP